MRAVVVYESIFGNTKQIAEAIGRGLAGALDVDVREVSAAPPGLVAGAELVVVGGPTHAWTMSRAGTRDDARRQARDLSKPVVSRGDGLREWLDTLPPSNGKQAAAAFDTVLRVHWMPTGSAAARALRRLGRLGYVAASAAQQFEVTAVDGPLADGEISRAERFGAELALKLATTLSTDNGTARAPASSG